MFFWCLFFLLVDVVFLLDVSVFEIENLFLDVFGVSIGLKNSIDSTSKKKLFLKKTKYQRPYDSRMSLSVSNMGLIISCFKWPL